MSVAGVGHAQLRGSMTALKRDKPRLDASSRTRSKRGGHAHPGREHPASGLTHSAIIGRYVRRRVAKQPARSEHPSSASAVGGGGDEGGRGPGGLVAPGAALQRRSNRQPPVSARNAGSIRPAATPPTLRTASAGRRHRPATAATPATPENHRPQKTSPGYTSLCNTGRRCTSLSASCLPPARPAQRGRDRASCASRIFPFKSLDCRKSIYRSNPFNAFAPASRLPSWRPSAWSPSWLPVRSGRGSVRPS